MTVADLKRKSWLDLKRVGPALVFTLACGTVLILSLRPVPEALPWLFSWQDKLEHALAFLVLTLLGCRGWPHLRWQVGLFVMAFGGLIELAQGMTTWRTADWMDWLADVVGVCLAFLPWWRLARCQRPDAALIPSETID